MPLYDYKCKSHGLFHDLVPIKQSGEGRPCPRCGQLSPRIIMIPPEVLAMSPLKRKEAERNEKAKHEPIISTVDSREEEADRKIYELRKSCGHNHTHNHSGCSHTTHPDQSSLRKQVVYMADGSKVFPSQRPWMISH